MRRLRPPGLRVRLVLALLLTSAVTLAVAALTLVPPLERRLRDEEVRSLVSTAVSSRSTFQDADLRDPNSAVQLAPLLRSLERHANARVVLVDAGLRPVVDTRPRIGSSRVDTTDDARDSFGDVKLALTRRRTVTSTVGGSQGVARVAMPLTINGHRYVLALREHLGDVARSVDTVKQAFLNAALVGFAIAVLIGIGLATTLLRRLRRLRDAALRLGARGLSAEAPRDRGRDEIGDLARAFVSMQTQLRAQEEARKRFVATASHELRNPLASLHGVLEPAGDDLSADPGGVARIIRILVDNALRFTPPDAPVEVELTHENGHAEITVSDRGPGVQSDEHEAIFERFRRGSAQGNGGGFGLGLAIGRELAERMGGSLALEDASEPGARFVLRLPSAESPA